VHSEKMYKVYTTLKQGCIVHVDARHQLSSN